MNIQTILLSLGLATATAIAVHAENWKLAVTDVEGLERLQFEWGCQLLLLL